MVRSDFCLELRKAAKALKNHLVQPQFSSWMESLLEKAEMPPTKAPKKKRKRKAARAKVYELLCYFYFVRHLAGKGIIHMIPGDEGDQSKAYRFPDNPGNKKAFARFQVVLDGLPYDICNGTEVNLSRPLQHPDVSIQCMSGVTDPATPGRIEAIWDAKEHSDGELTKGDINQMIAWAVKFQSMPMYAEDDFYTKYLPPKFSVRGVITNTGESGIELDNDELLKCHFSIFLSFNGQKDDIIVKPSRDEHLEYIGTHKGPIIT